MGEKAIIDHLSKPTSEKLITLNYGETAKIRHAFQAYKDSHPVKGVSFNTLADEMLHFSRVPEHPTEIPRLLRLRFNFYQEEPRQNTTPKKRTFAPMAGKTISRFLKGETDSPKIVATIRDYLIALNKLHPSALDEELHWFSAAISLKEMIRLDISSAWDSMVSELENAVYVSTFRDHSDTIIETLSFSPVCEAVFEVYWQRIFPKELATSIAPASLLTHPVGDKEDGRFWLLTLQDHWFGFNFGKQVQVLKKINIHTHIYGQNAIPRSILADIKEIQDSLTPAKDQATENNKTIQLLLKKQHTDDIIELDGGEVSLDISSPRRFFNEKHWGQMERAKLQEAFSKTVIDRYTNERLQRSHLSNMIIGEDDWYNERKPIMPLLNMLSAGVDPNTVIDNRLGWRAIHLAALHLDRSLFDALLENKATDLLVRDARGRLPMDLFPMDATSQYYPKECQMHTELSEATYDQARRRGIDPDKVGIFSHEGLDDIIPAWTPDGS